MNAQNALAARGHTVFYTAIALFVISLALDLGSKEWALDNLSTESIVDPGPVCEGRYNQRVRTAPVTLIDDIFEFRYAENCGAAFSLLADAPKAVRMGVFFVAGIIIIVVLLRLWWKGSGGTFFFWAVPLIVSGAVGNLADRARHGFVVDFIHVYKRDLFDYPTFNVADIAITIGIAFMIIDSLLEGKREKAAARAAQDKDAA